MTKLATTILAKLQDQAPALAKELRARGELDQYVADLAEEAGRAVTDGVGNARIDQRWDRLDPIMMVGKMNALRAELTEQVIAEIDFENPPDSRVRVPLSFPPGCEFVASFSGDEFVQFPDGRTFKASDDGEWLLKWPLPSRGGPMSEEGFLSCCANSRMFAAGRTALR
jgi:hypothetical protein